MFGLVVLLFLGAVAVARRPQPPSVEPDCARAAFHLSATSVAQNRTVAYTIVGPDGREFALGLDTRTFERGPDGRWRGVPKPGYEQTFLEPAPAARLTGCKRDGVFATPVPLGTHTVTLYELTDRGALFVTEQRLEVTEP